MVWICLDGGRPQQGPEARPQSGPAMEPGWLACICLACFAKHNIEVVCVAQQNVVFTKLSKANVLAKCAWTMRAKLKVAS